MANKENEKLGDAVARFRYFLVADQGGEKVMGLKALEVLWKELVAKDNNRKLPDYEEFHVFKHLLDDTKVKKLNEMVNATLQGSGMKSLAPSASSSFPSSSGSVPGKQSSSSSGDVVRDTSRKKLMRFFKKSSN